MNCMEQRKIIMCRGIQSSGKSTWARNWALEDPEHRIRYNNDDIRNMLGQYWIPSREDIVASAKSSILSTAMTNGYDIVIDNMNLNVRDHDNIMVMIANYEMVWHKYHYVIEFQDFPTPVEECIRRDSLRPNPIGEEVIRNTYNKYKEYYEWL